MNYKKWIGKNEMGNIYRQFIEISKMLKKITKIFSNLLIIKGIQIKSFFYQGSTLDDIQSEL